jgi:hypothetical protein
MAPSMPETKDAMACELALLVVAASDGPGG